MGEIDSVCSIIIMSQLGQQFYMNHVNDKCIHSLISAMETRFNRRETGNVLHLFNIDLAIYLHIYSSQFSLLGGCKIS